MNIEDRVRAATRARTDLVRDIRPLELPDELPARIRRRRPARRWVSWGAPIAAAALITAVALVLVMLRQTGAGQSGPATPAAGQSVSASIPRYYVTLDHMEAVVGDDQTGRKLAVIPPPAGQNFYGVTAAADDRTFVLMNSQPAQQETNFYLLRITPGAAHPAQLTKLPVEPVPFTIEGGRKLGVTSIALSSDGRELAIAWRAASTATNQISQVSVYSTSSGALLKSWSTTAPNDNFALPSGLTWVNGDRTVDFEWDDVVPAYITERIKGTSKRVRANVDKLTVRTLNVTAAGHDLLADSRVIAQVPSSMTQTKTASATPCGVTLLSSDGILVCGSSGSGNASFQPACPTADPTIASYSATGKLLQVLYRWQAAQCLSANTTVMWTSPDGSTAIASLNLSLKGIKVTAPESSRFGIVSGGHLTVLPPLLAGDYANIAF